MKHFSVYMFFFLGGNSPLGRSSVLQKLSLKMKILYAYTYPQVVCLSYCNEAELFLIDQQGIHELM